MGLRDNRSLSQQDQRPTVNVIVLHVVNKMAVKGRALSYDWPLVLLLWNFPLEAACCFYIRDCIFQIKQKLLGWNSCCICLSLIHQMAWWWAAGLPALTMGYLRNLWGSLSSMWETRRRPLAPDFVLA